jgi:transposase
MEKITLTRKQLKRHTIITQVIDGFVTREKAAKLLELSVRQIDRIKKSYLRDGIASLIHKNTGRKPAHALDESVKREIVLLRKTKPYSQANYKHFQELLAVGRIKALLEVPVRSSSFL